MRDAEALLAADAVDPSSAHGATAEEAGAERVDASVLTPVLDEEEHIASALAAMRAQAFEGRLEFLFIDGGSRDRTRTILEEAAAEDPRVRVLENPHRRTPHALNIGLAHARGEHVVRMDAHTLYREDYVALGVKRLRRGDVEWASGVQEPHGVGRRSRQVALALGSRLGTGGAAFRRAGGGEIEVDTGFTGVWRRETLARHGGWDEGWPVNQDAELAARIRKAGGRIVCLPEMTAGYIPRDSLRALARQYLRYGHYRAKTSVRHPGSMRRSHLLPPALVLTALAALAGPRALRRPARAAVGFYGAALLAASAAQSGRASRADAAVLPAVFATMHGAWGAGFLAGLARYGIPRTAR